MVEVSKNDIILAKVHGIPAAEVKARILSITGLLSLTGPWIIVFVKWRGFSIRSHVEKRNIFCNVTRRLQEETRRLQLERSYRTISPAVMHWAFRPGGVLQRRLVVDGQMRLARWQLP